MGEEMFRRRNTRVIVGMSGGVDSSVAALRLLEQGFEVAGLFMKNWEEDDRDGVCTATQDLGDAQQVCDRLDIRLHLINFSSEYWDRVFQHFLDEYAAGRTPNPDILCNKEIKFKAFLDYAEELGADYIATGHYARIDCNDGKYRLLKGTDRGKDQSYFLYTLGQAQLAATLFPLGDLEKEKVRDIAHKAGFGNYRKKDSTGICFIGERKFRDFLGRYLPARPGEIRTPDGDYLGAHHGLMFYTLGQRKGLGIGGRHGFGEAPWYVVGKDLERNLLLVAQGHDHPLLYCEGLTMTQAHWVSGRPPTRPFRCSAKVRYRQADQPCTLGGETDGHGSVDFDQPQRAVTPGQSVVFYQGEVCVGGGVIETAATR